MPATHAHLNVHYRTQLVGRLTETASGRMTFQYDAEWLGSDKSFPISISMPLAVEPYGDVAHHWFTNLLPEERQRAMVAQRLKISETNDFGLLRALGGECAGALTLDEGDALQPQQAAARAIDDAEIQRWIVNRRELPLVDQKRAVRLSLAGAQDKIPVIVTDGRLFLPEGGAPSTHILKLPSQEFNQVPENEYFVTSLASAWGLPTHAISLRPIGKTYVTLARRYDRVVSAHGATMRLHQEDFCQAMGLPSFKKYEADGGPTLDRCINLASRELPQPAVAIDRLLKWTIFNLLLGNCDAHAKNLSFVWQADGRTELAPFYDLVSTMAYDGLDQKLALHIGGESDPALIAGGHWQQLARAIRIKPKTLTDEVAAACDQIASLFEPTLQGMTAQGLTFTKSAEVERVLRTQSRRIRRQLSS